MAASGPRQALRRLRRRIQIARGRPPTVAAERLIWIVGFARSGTTWLGRMMRDAQEDPVWNEPSVGVLFGDFYVRSHAEGRPDNFILAPSRRELWLRSIRTMVMEGAAARFGPAIRRGRVIIKEPHGSLGVPLISQALPESSLVFLVRDPRDVVASALDAASEGSWARRTAAEQGRSGPAVPGGDRDEFARRTARRYREGIASVSEAYASHPGPKARTRYEDLRADPLGELRRIYSDLGVQVEEATLLSAVEANTWENLPAEQKGKGKMFRRGEAGGWKDELTPAQVGAVEAETASLLDHFYREHEPPAPG